MVALLTVGGSLISNLDALTEKKLERVSVLHMSMSSLSLAPRVRDNRYLKNFVGSILASPRVIL